MLFAIVPDRPVAVEAARQAAESLGYPDTMADVVADFERLAHLPPGSTRWAVADISLR